MRSRRRDDEEVDCGLCCLAFIYAGLGFALGFLHWLLIVLPTTHTHTHTSTHRCRVLQQSVSISFHLYTFLFALATCFHTSRCLPHFFPYCFLPLTTSLSFSLPFSLCQSSYIYFFSIIGSIYFAQLFLPPPPFVLCLFMLHFDFLSLNCICCFYFR